MTSLTLALVLQTASFATGANTYSEAHGENARSGRPMVILVGADWCPACQQMKNTALPQVARRGLLKKVAYAVVNTDQQGPLARRLMSGGSIPQLIMYRKTNDGWKRDSLVGAQDPAAIESFINRGLEGLAPPESAIGATGEVSSDGSE